MVGGCTACFLAFAALVLILPEPLFYSKLLIVQRFPETTTNNQDHPHPCFILRLTKADAPYVEFRGGASVTFQDRWDVDRTVETRRALT
jgi:hypothetical protein